jgi:hypothetical protein
MRLLSVTDVCRLVHFGVQGKSRSLNIAFESAQLIDIPAVMKFLYKPKSVMQML